MALNVTFNPPEFEDDYVAALNECFGHWGDASLYDWAFRRTAGSHASDLMIVHDDNGELLAGSAVSYRRVAGPEYSFEAGIMTGSWTLPPARGQGCFTRIVEESRLIAGERGCDVLLAFVTWDNASRRRLEEAGSRMVPSRYVFTPNAEQAWDGEPLPCVRTSATENELWRTLEHSRKGAFHFAYPGAGDFVGQLLRRPDPVETYEVGGAVVLLEVTENTDRVAAVALRGESQSGVLHSLAARAHDRGRRFFAFTMGEPDFAALDTKEGFLTILPTPRCALPVEELTQWHIDSGDRM